MLTEKDVFEVLKFIANSDEKCATDVVYALTLLNTNVNNMLESVKGEMLNSIADNKFNDLDTLKVFCNNIMLLHEQIELSIQTLINDSDNAKKANDIIKIENNISEKNISYRVIPNYSDYEVNRYEAHYLNEDFEFKKICAINFFGKYQEVNSQRDALIKVCETLYKENPNKIISLISSPDFKGKKLFYFSDKILYDKTGQRSRNTRLKGSNIYVLTNLSANDTVKFIKKILIYFKKPLNECVVYLRADYKDLHR